MKKVKENESGDKFLAELRDHIVGDTDVTKLQGKQMDDYYARVLSLLELIGYKYRPDNTENIQWDAPVMRMAFNETHKILFHVADLQTDKPMTRNVSFIRVGLNLLNAGDGAFSTYPKVNKLKFNFFGFPVYDFKVNAISPGIEKHHVIACVFKTLPRVGTETTSGSINPKIRDVYMALGTFLYNVGYLGLLKYTNKKKNRGENIDGELSLLNSINTENMQRLQFSYMKFQSDQ